MVCFTMMKKFIHIFLDISHIEYTEYSNSRNSQDIALAILGVSANTQIREVRKAYLSLIKKCHPDRFVEAEYHIQEEMSEKTKLINWAYDELKRFSA